MAADLVANDTGTQLSITLKKRKTLQLIDLTDATVRLKWRIDGAALVTRVMTIVDAAGGVATYQFADGELTAVPFGSTLTAEVEVTDAAGKILTGLTPIELKVRAKV